MSAHNRQHRCKCIFLITQPSVSASLYHSEHNNLDRLIEQGFMCVHRHYEAGQGEGLYKFLNTMLPSSPRLHFTLFTSVTCLSNHCLADAGSLNKGSYLVQCDAPVHPGPGVTAIGWKDRDGAPLILVGRQANFMLFMLHAFRKSNPQ